MGGRHGPAHMELIGYREASVGKNGHINDCYTEN